MALLVCLWAGSAQAGQWQTEQQASIFGRYTDNPALQPKGSNPPSTALTVAVAEASFVYADPSGEFSFVPRAQGRYYFDRDFSDLDSLDFFLTSGGRLIRQRYSLNLNVRFDYQSILSSEDTDPENPDDGGSGNFLRADDTRTRIGIAPSITLQLSTQDTLVLGANYTKIDYDLDFTGRADNESYTANVNYQRILTERSSVNVVGAWIDSNAERRGIVVQCDGSLFPDPDCEEFLLSSARILTDSDGYTANLIYNYNLSERLTLSAGYGRQSTEVENSIRTATERVIAASDEFTSNQYLARLSGQNERTNWNAGISQTVQPNTNGSPAERTQLEGDITHRFSERLVGTIAAVAYRQTVVSALQRRTNEFLRTDVTLTRRLSQNWTVSGTYTYRQQNPFATNLVGEPVPEDENLKRISNTISLSTRYRFR